MKNTARYYCTSIIIYLFLTLYSSREQKIINLAMNNDNQFHPYRRKQIRRTNYNERFNALSTVEVRTRHFIQLEWARCMDEEECYLKYGSSIFRGIP